MPHMNFIFPFVPREKFSDIKSRLDAALADFPKFEVILDQLSTFYQKQGYVTFHLTTDDHQRLDELFELIKTTLPEIPIKYPKFKAHLTLGECRTCEFYTTIKSAVNSKLAPIDYRFMIDSIYIIARSKENNKIPFNIVHTIQLKGS